MRELPYFLFELEQHIARSRTLRYEIRGKQREQYYQWWHSLLVLISEVDKEFQTEFSVQFNEAIFLPTDEVKKQLDVSGFTHQYEIEQEYMAEGFRIGVERIRSQCQMIHDWVKKHGETSQSFFRIDPQNKIVLIQELLPLLGKIANTNENEFLSETIKCCYVGAWRAAAVMVWNLTMFHLHNFIFDNKLHQFNPCLKNEKKKKTRIDEVTTRHDLLEIGDDEFILFCRRIGALSKNRIQTLERNLSVRNTYAHPSELTMTRPQAVAMISELITNIILEVN